MFACLFPLSFPLLFPWCHHILFRQAWAEGKGELATCRHCADSGREKETVHDLAMI